MTTLKKIVLSRDTFDRLIECARKTDPGLHDECAALVCEDSAPAEAGEAKPAAKKRASKK